MQGVFFKAVIRTKLSREIVQILTQGKIFLMQKHIYKSQNNISLKEKLNLIVSQILQICILSVYKMWI